jgi:hypothetical protein
MIGANAMQVQALLLRGMVSKMGPDDRAAFAEACRDLHASVARQGEMGFIALTVVAAEVLAQHDTPPRPEPCWIP